MDEQLINYLNDFKNNQIDMPQLLDFLKTWPFEDLGFAKIDKHRQLRNGFPEVIFGQNKNPQQLATIFQHLQQSSNRVLATRVSSEGWEAIHMLCPDVQYHKTAGCVTWQKSSQLNKGPILIISAGTADLPVAEETVVSCELMGNQTIRLYDTGVAGLHRLLNNISILNRAQVIIVIAGMDGALPSVVGGLTDKPVIAVPTSIGYGASFSGLAALLSMLNSCASGIGVVNIDNGFGAAALANSITSLSGG